METDVIKETLFDVGLSEDEIKIYVALLKHGQCIASKIAEETKINRSHTYQLLERLITKGFISYVIKENKKYFSAVHPEKILEIVQEKEQKLKNILPSLISLNTIAKQKPLVEIFEGKEGIKTILYDILKIKKDWLVFGSSGKGKDILSFYAEHWEKEREKLGIHLLAIMDKSHSAIKRGKELAKLKHTQVRYLNETYSYPSSTWIYGDRIALVIWDKEHSFAIRIVSKAIASNYKKHFDFLWKVASK